MPEFSHVGNDVLYILAPIVGNIHFPTKNSKVDSNLTTLEALRISVPRTWELVAPTTLSCGSTQNQARRVGVSPLPRFDFTLSSVEPRSKIMFLSTSCQSGAKQTTNSKSPNISF